MGERHEGGCVIQDCAELPQKGGWEMEDARCQVSGVRCQVSGRMVWIAAKRLKRRKSKIVFVFFRGCGEESLVLKNIINSHGDTKARSIFNYGLQE